MGLLVVRGVLGAKQFWPGGGRSDADTATVELAAKDPFVFVEDSGKRRVTRAFENAEVVGAQRKAPIKQSKGSAVRKITIRLQGIDAPELHYQPKVAGAPGLLHPYRQSLGETSADALHDFVASLGVDALPCEVLTAVKKPSDVCDVYGRFVGNIVLIRGGSRIDINQWLLREGWALPGLYNSMSHAEMVAVVADHQAARQAKRGLFSKPLVTEKLAAFNPQQLERKGPASFKPFSDKGPVNFPKFFRRQAEHYVRDAAGQNVPANLRAFIGTKPDDLALERAKFLKLKGQLTGKKPRPEFRQLATFLGGGYPFGPELVYWEKDSMLVKAGTSAEVTQW